MSNIFVPIINNLQTLIENGGYTLLFFLTVLEGIPLIGTFVPGNTMVFVAGFLAKLDVFDIYAVGFIVILAAMLGDLSGYYLGKRYGYNFLDVFGKFFYIKKEYIEKAKTIVGNHTGKAIILGRFNPITRPLIPFIIGASGVHINKFWLWDFVGAILWGVSSVAVGYIFGASYHLVAGIFGKYVMMAILISILIVWGYRFVNNKFHVFAKYELFVLILNLIGLYAFFKIIQDVLREYVYMEELDEWINLFFSTHATSNGLVTMNLITDIFSPTLLSILSLGFIIYMIIKRHWLYATITFLSIGGGLFIGGFVKEVVERIRPLQAFILETDFSFPSVHAIMATIFFTLLVYILVPHIKSWILRESLIVVSVMFIILTAVSRLYLGVHWFSDVVAGCALGLFWTTSVILLVRYISIISRIFRSSFLK
jgi:undecaprenyl-diphosphatase